MLGRVCSVVTVAVIAATGWAVAVAGPSGSSAFPGVNGKVVFEQDVGGNLDIYVMEPDGTDVRRLTTDPEADFEPSWSADGKEIVFISTRTGLRDIYVMDADGSDQRRLTTDDAGYRSPSFSPDGEHIASARNDDDIFVMDDDGGNQRNISNLAPPRFAIEPTWSPDGDQIAFSLFTGSDFEIFVIRPDGSGLTNLTNENALDFEATWSPDGEQIAFGRFASGATEVWAMNSDGSGQRNLTNDPAADGLPAWSPDGEQIAFVSSRDGGGIFVMGAGGGTASRISPTGTEPNWRPVALEGDVTVTKAVVGSPPPGTTFTVEIDCDGEQDDKVLTFGETGGTETIERESFESLECEVTETQTGGAASVDVACDAGEDAECLGPDSFELFDDADDDGSEVHITVTNTFAAAAAVLAEPTFTG